MKTIISTLLPLAIVILANSPAPAQFRDRREGIPNAGQYGWLPSLSQGKAQAEKTGKPIMVVVRCVP
ncbi:MAG TPA: hypothetical protein VKS79_26200 [Gemmataceae bacterium]|nr:hypothetical protein [Gemmataceae bacterium]